MLRSTNHNARQRIQSTSFLLSITLMIMIVVVFVFIFCTFYHEQSIILKNVQERELLADDAAKLKKGYEEPCNEDSECGTFETMDVDGNPKTLQLKCKVTGKLGTSIFGSKYCLKNRLKRRIPCLYDSECDPSQAEASSILPITPLKMACPIHWCIR